ncbi:MAG: phosphotransferase [Rickettsiales bacterium]
MSLRESEIRAFLVDKGWHKADVWPIPGDASFRHYARVIDDVQHRRAILMDAPPDKEEVTPFLNVRAYLFAGGYSAPDLLAADERSGFLLLEDFGDLSFSRLIREKPEREGVLYRNAMDVLLKFQRDGLAGYPAIPEYDHAMLMREAMVPAEWFFPEILSGHALEHAVTSWKTLWDELLKAHDLRPEVVVHRDYHADNLFWLEGRQGIRTVGMLDFQDAVLGKPAYDVVSLLEDARRDLDESIVRESLAYYIEQAGIDKDSFMREYAFFGAQRNAKILGIFTRLYRRDGKPRYLAMMPRVWNHFARDIAHPALSPLKAWVEKHLPRDMDKALAALQEKSRSAA